MQPASAPQTISEVYGRLDALSKSSGNKNGDWNHELEAEWTRWCFVGLPQDAEKQGQAGTRLYRGKVRDLVSPLSSKFSSIHMIHSDRLSAFDRFIGLVPQKGVILTALCKFWFERCASKNHYISSPDPRTLTVASLDPIKVEVVVRGYLAGSMMRAYEKGERSYCGVKLPEGLKPYDKLPEPIITPTTKAAAFQHDENTTAEALVAAGVCSAREWDTICTKAFEIFGLGREVFGQAGWILADTKYEFGKNKGGEVVLMDEIHTPDSSRLWISASYDKNLSIGLAPEMLDKENTRRFLMGQGFNGHGDVPVVPPAEFMKLGKTYLHVAEALIGSSLQAVSYEETFKQWSKLI